MSEEHLNVDLSGKTAIVTGASRGHKYWRHKSDGAQAYLGVGGKGSKE